MKLLYEGYLRGNFRGWKDREFFELDNGSIYQQKYYKYKYFYSYRPKVKLWYENGKYFLEVECMKDSIEVKKIK